jgi:hypothetical protein
MSAKLGPAIYCTPVPEVGLVEWAAMVTKLNGDGTVNVSWAHNDDGGWTFRENVTHVEVSGTPPETGVYVQATS